MKVFILLGMSILILFQPLYAGCINVSSAPTQSTPISANLQVKRDICYSSANDLSRSYDIYASNFSSMKPLFIFIHGGGWTDNANAKIKMVEENIPTMVSYLAETKGYAVASINYRGTAPGSSHNMDTVIADVRQAILQVIQHAAQNKTDGNKVFLLGTSAGAHLASLAGSTYPTRSKVKGVAAYKGVYELRGPWKGGSVEYFFAELVDLTFSTNASWYKKAGASCGQESQISCHTVVAGHCHTERLIKALSCAVESNLWEDGNQVNNSQYSRSQTLALFNSPINYYTSLTPPHFLVHGAEDNLVPIGQAIQAKQKLDSLGVPSQLCTISFEDHSFQPVALAGSPCWSEFVSFINNL